MNSIRHYLKIFKLILKAWIKEQIITLCLLLPKDLSKFSFLQLSNCLKACFYNGIKIKKVFVSFLSPNSDVTFYNSKVFIFPEFQKH